jgi:ribonuclease HIII
MSYSCALTLPQRERLREILAAGNYRPVAVPHTIVAVEGPDCRVNLYTSGKLLVQGKGTEDFVMFVLEPNVLQRAGLGYEEVLDPGATAPHMGIDESGKGDFFGPLVVAAAYTDPVLAGTMRQIGVRDSKQMTDKQIFAVGARLRALLGRNRYALVTIGPETYNRLYAGIRNVNRLLSWAHARAIENLLDTMPDCPRAVADQFGAAHQIERALMKKGRAIVLEQHHKAEADIAVAAASVLARECFLRALQRLGKEHGLDLPKGASAAVREAALALVRREGPAILLKTAKCHFRTADEVLAAAGASRAALGPAGAAVSRGAGNAGDARPPAGAGHPTEA